MTNSTIYSPIINLISTQFECAYISPFFNSASTDFRFFMHPNLNFTVQSINNLISFIQMKQIYLLCSSNSDDLQICDGLMEINSNFKEIIKYSSGIKQDYADMLVGKMLKANAAKSVVVVDTSFALEYIINSIINKNLNVSGSSVIILKKGQETSWIFGSFVLIEKDLEESSSLLNFEQLSIQNLLNLIPSYNSRSDLLLYLQSKYPSHILSEKISILNPNPLPVIVGTLSPSVGLTSSIVYPGNQSTYDPNSKLDLKFSIANGTTEIFNMTKNSLFATWYKGAEFAVGLTNRENLLPGFQVTLQPTDCGLYFYNQAFYNKCLLQYQDFGLAYLAPFWQGAANGTYRALLALNLSIPQISPICQNIELDNKSEFPLFLKLSVSASLYYSSAFLFQRSLGWKCLNVLATNDPIYQEQYNDILTYSKLAGIEVLNPREKQVFPWNYTRDDFEQYRNYFEAAKENRCRVFAILAYDRGLIWEGLYDVGIRKGDFVQIGASAILAYLNSDLEEKFLRKRKEIIEFSFVIAYREWIGDIGEMVYFNLSKLYSDTSYMCFSYDTFQVVKEAIKFIMTKGENYENQTELAKVMRNNRITGCLGNVFFDKDSNSRAQAEFSIYQVIDKASKGQFGYVHVAYINKLGSVMIKRTNDLTWHKSTSIPDSFRPINNCPFDNYLIQKSQKGLILLFSICGYFALVTILSTIKNLQSYNSVNEELSEKKLIKFSDMIFLSYFLFQTIQIINYGPEQKAFMILAEKLVSMDFFKYFYLDFLGFWGMFYLTMTFSFCWSVLCFFITFWRCDRVLVGFEYLNLGFFLDYIMPILGHMTISPIFSMHLSIFLCTEGIDPTLSKSFLQDDCFTFCYKSSHLIAASISISLSTLYIFFTIFSRPYWELTMPDLNLKTSPKYLIYLTCFQFFTVLLSKSLKIYDQSVHGYVLSSLIFLFIIITYKTKPYNYNRVNLIQISSLTLGFWVILTASTFQYSLNLYIYTIIMLSGMIFIIISTLVLLKKYPELIYSDPSLNIAELFLFQFRKQVKFSPDPNNLKTQPQFTIETIKEKSDIRIPTQL